jgi:hypothetical protein
MAKKKQSAPAPAPAATTVAVPTMSVKERRRIANEEAAKRNKELRALGKPTPWEEKRAARKAERAAKQAAYKEKQDRIHEVNRERDAREQRQKDALAKELLREATKSSRRKVAAAAKRG